MHISQFSTSDSHRVLINCFWKNKGIPFDVTISSSTTSDADTQARRYICQDMEIMMKEHNPIATVTIYGFNCFTVSQYLELTICCLSVFAFAWPVSVSVIRRSLSPHYWYGPLECLALRSLLVLLGLKFIKFVAINGVADRLQMWLWLKRKLKVPKISQQLHRTHHLGQNWKSVLDLLQWNWMEGWNWASKPLWKNAVVVVVTYICSPDLLFAIARRVYPG